MTEELVRRVVLAALNGESGDGGWLKIDAPNVTDKEISLAIMEASERGLVKACDVSDMQSAYPEWRLIGPSGASSRYIREAVVAKSSDDPAETENTAMNTRDVFVIHGRDERLRAGMFDFLKSLDLHPMEWEYAVHLTGKATPYVGQVLDAAFSHARAVVVLFTPDDVAKLRPDLCGNREPEHEVTLWPQSRPNVLFEAGMAMARNANRTILVEIGALRPFSDAGGRHAIRMDNSVEKRKALALRLQNAGCAVNLTGDWEKRGDLSAPERWVDPEKGHRLSAVETIAKLEEENRQLRIIIAEGNHIRLVPKFEVTQFVRQTTDTFDQVGKKNGSSEYFQLLPRCLTETNVEECRGLLTSIEMLDGFSNKWEEAEWEVMFLEWSHGDASPITLYPHAERRLNVFFMHSGNREIRPCVTPYPVRFLTMFNQPELRQIIGIRFNIRVIAKDCQAVELVMKVQFGGDYSHPTVELETGENQASAVQNPGT